MRFKVVIPARYASQRLPGKPLVQIAGRPMLQHVYDNAVASGADEVIIATDDERIGQSAEGFGAQACMTSPDHASGTDRIAEAAMQLGWDENTLIVNLQGDEPLMPPANIYQVAENLHRYSEAGIATLCTPILSQEELLDPNIVKVLRDRHGFALYFSRAPIPVEREQRASAPVRNAYRHIGLYAYRLDYLKAYLETPTCDMERLERLEQLRALWRGDKIHVDLAQETPGPGVDTRQDLMVVESFMAR
jgi:3-deoxy-manno-octulosonate cytidylyltransferase (CMP-KDO synthetase)